MIEDSAELAGELAERFSVATVDGGQSDSDAIACLLQRCPLTNETAAGYSGFLDGVSNPHNALPIEAGAAAELRGLLIPFCNAEKEEAQPDREALAQYIGLGFALYSQCETQDGKRKFCDWRTGKPSKQPQSVIKTLAELDAALAAGIRLFSFLPSERSFVCIDVDCGHENGADGFKNVASWLEARGFARGYNPLNEARAYVDTPSGGRHCYFTGRATYLAKIPGLDSVGVFGEGTGATLTAAGSVKKGKVYRLHGRLEDATPINAAFAGYFTNDEYTESARQAERENASANAKPSAGRRFKGGAEYTLAEKVEYYRRKYSNNPNSEGERHDALRHVVIRLGWQYAEGDLYAACLANPIFATLPESELRGTVNYYHKKSVKQP